MKKSELQAFAENEVAKTELNLFVFDGKVAVSFKSFPNDPRITYLHSILSLDVAVDRSGASTFYYIVYIKPYSIHGESKKVYMAAGSAEEAFAVVDQIQSMIDRFKEENGIER